MTTLQVVEQLIRVEEWKGKEEPLKQSAMSTNKGEFRRREYESVAKIVAKGDLEDQLEARDNLLGNSRDTMDFFELGIF